MIKQSKYIHALVVIFLLHIPITRTLAAPLLVLYPEAPEPYREAFAQMMDGIARTAGGPLDRKMITAATKPADLQEWLATESGAKAVVLLGQKALSFYDRGPQPGRAVFVGGVNALPGQTPLPGVSLTLDPALYLQTLHELLPDIRRVVVYYNAQEQPWIVLVKKAAMEMQVSVEGIASNDAFDVVRQLGTTFKALDSKTTALWFGRNTIALNAELIYPYVLEQTWDRNIAVFSETVAHVRRGFLFALYPDYAKIGAELGALIQQGTPSPNAGLRFSRAGQLTLNTRTARHLGITPRDGLIQRAKPLFPEP